MDSLVRYVENYQNGILPFINGYAEFPFGKEIWFEDLFFQHVNLFIEILAADIATDHDFR